MILLITLDLRFYILFSHYIQLIRLRFSRTVLDFWKIYESSTEFPDLLLLTSYTNMVYLLQSMKQYAYSIIN